MASGVITTEASKWVEPSTDKVKQIVSTVTPYNPKVNGARFHEYQQQLITAGSRLGCPHILQGIQPSLHAIQQAYPNTATEIQTGLLQAAQIEYSDQSTFLFHHLIMPTLIFTGPTAEI